MRQFSAALFEAALGLLGALFPASRGRHARTAGFFAFRRRSKRVRRYAADPAPAVRSLPDRPPVAARVRELAPPREAFPADEIPLVRPYFAAHERSAAARRTEAPRHTAPAADEHELARIQEQALARLRGWTTPNTSHPQMPAAPAVPQPRSAPAGDILISPPEPPARPAARHRRPTGPSVPTGHAKPRAGEGYEELAAVTRRWLAQQERQEVRV